MIIIGVQVPNYYTCQNCGKEVELTNSVEIINEIAPFCDYKCFFNAIYKIVKKGDILVQIEISSAFLPHKIIKSVAEMEEKDLNAIIFDNTKVITKELLSSEKGGLSPYQSLIKRE